MNLAQKYPKQRGGPPAAIAAYAAVAGAGAGIYGAVRASKQPKLPTPPPPPTQDTAANNAQQQALMLRRRRGVLSNIFGGQNPNAMGGGAAGNTQLGT